jgi:hypothetical protein
MRLQVEREMLTISVDETMAAQRILQHPRPVSLTFQRTIRSEGDSKYVFAVVCMARQVTLPFSHLAVLAHFVLSSPFRSLTFRFSFLASSNADHNIAVTCSVASPDSNPIPLAQLYDYEDEGGGGYDYGDYGDGYDEVRARGSMRRWSRRRGSMRRGSRRRGSRRRGRMRVE